MSLSISNSESSADTVREPTDSFRSRYIDTELRWARRLALASPILLLVVAPLIHHYLLTVMYLKPVPSGWDLGNAFRSKAAIALTVALAGIPWLWWMGIKADALMQRSKLSIAVISAIALMVIAGWMLSTTRASWFFVEWAKVRTPNPSFARNTLFWEQRNFPAIESPHSKSKVALVGSSQTNQGFDLQQLQTACPQMSFEKNTLAGFGPMQYPFLDGRISERGPQIVVCHLSEFDFYREDAVPIERLRWAATLAGTNAIRSTLTPAQVWKDRGALADLAFASLTPLWRHRDHFRRTLFGYWWDKSLPPAGQSDQPNRLADAPQLQEAVIFLKQNIGHKQLVEANFASFRQFAQQQKQRGVRLMVVEGQVHPQARIAYDTLNLQQTTRRRLSEMATQHDFDYFDSKQMPTFTSADFADAYHLNDQGRSKLTDFLAQQLKPES